MPRLPGASAIPVNRTESITTTSTTIVVLLVDRAVTPNRSWIYSITVMDGKNLMAGITITRVR